MNRIGNIPLHHYIYYLLAIWAVLSLPSLGLAPLFDYDETIYAQTAADMMHLGEWVVPTANGSQFFEKPPFTYYMMDICFSVFGENAFAARLPSALFTLFTAILLFRFGRDTHSPQFGMAAALIFLSMLEVGILGHAAILDAVLNFFIAGCLLNYFRWLQSGERKAALWCAAMMGLAVSIKGPVGAVIPILVIMIDRLIVGDLFRVLKNIPWLPALTLFFITATPWYLMIFLEHGIGFLYEFIVVQNIGRALHPMQGHGGGWYYYIIVFMISVLPWLAWMPYLIKAWQRNTSEPLNQMIRLSLLWSVIVLVLFSFAQTKLPHYISCLYPAIALGITAAWWRKAPNSSQLRIIQRTTIFILLPISLALIIFPVIYPSLIAWVHNPRAIAVLSQDIQPSFFITLAGIILFAALVYLWRNTQQRFALHSFIILGLLLESCLIIPLGSFAGKIAQAPQSHIAEVMQSLPKNMPIYSYNLNFPSMSFQSRRSYQIVLNQQGIQTLQAETLPYGLILRSESREQLVWLKNIQPIVDQGGFLFYVVNP
ncbi:MAG: glycosyltransferase family 39 protein [Mariprofundaceae bacterium]|nr:glycosyltransferase family 39 protein [Mariprofundaceae bacterium]